jgi:protein-S-isoprenylcysteine O-methyltransferase Ste14
MEPATTAPTLDTSRPRRRGWLLGALVNVLKLGAAVGLLFGTAGRLDWAAGWASLALFVAAGVANVMILRSKNPGLLARRMRIGQGTKRWDNVLMRIIVLLPMAIIVVAGLDAGRFGWSSMPAWLWPAGAGLYVVGFALTTWAMVVNTHFEGTVRIQTDLGHQVVDTGPYRLVRHPGYVAMFLVILGMPLLFGSWWAFIPAALNVALLVARTALEDATLRRELEGYAGYARRIRYRLVPGVW